MDDSPPDPEKSNQVEEKERVRRHVGQAKKKHDLGTSFPPLNFVISTLLPQGHTLIHLSGCTIGLSRNASSTEGNSLKLSPWT